MATEVSDDAIDAALQRGDELRETMPHGVKAEYEAATARILVEFSNGCLFAFPARLAQGLETATEADLAAVELSPSGYGLHWEPLDVDLSLPGLFSASFGTRAHMARLAGQTRSISKAAAARRNGAKGGRPRKAK